MKTHQPIYRVFSLISVLIFCLAANLTFAQVAGNPDTLKKVPADTLKAAPAAVPVVVPAKPAAAPEETKKTEAAKTDESSPVDDGKDKKKDKKGKKNEIILYTGANFTQLTNSSGHYESEPHAGYQLGAYYKQGRFFYWQAGARYASAVIGYKPAGVADSAEFSSLKVSDLDIPLTLGINFTSVMNRVLSVRLFVSAVPSFTMKVDDPDYGITKDKVNSFILYGQGGLGVNVAFMVLEAGYNYGFNELLTGNTDSKPGQLFINLGFRF